MAQELTLICLGQEQPRPVRPAGGGTKGAALPAGILADGRPAKPSVDGGGGYTPSGVNLELYQFLAFLRTHPGCLEGTVGGVVIDGTGDLYTKAAGRDVVLSASRAGCVFPGRPLVEATGTLRNFTVQAKTPAAGWRRPTGWPLRIWRTG